MMEAFTITDDNAELFDPVFGEDLADDMHRVYYRGIGVLDPERNPAGTLVFELLDAEDQDKDTKAFIRFASFPNEEAQKAVLRFYAENLVDEEEIGETGYALKDEGTADALTKAGFSKEKRESEEIHVTLEELANTDLAKRKQPPSFIRNITDLSLLQYRNAVKEALFKGHKGLLEDLPYLPKNWFDEEVSSCSISDDEADGIFLIRKTPSGVLIPALLFAHGPEYKKTLLHLITYSVKAAIEKLPPKTKVRITRRDAATKALTGKLLPNSSGREVFFGSRKE